MPCCAAYIQTVIACSETAAVPGAENTALDAGLLPKIFFFLKLIKNTFITKTNFHAKPKKKMTLQNLPIGTSGESGPANHGPET